MIRGWTYRGGLWLVNVAMALSGPPETRPILYDTILLYDILYDTILDDIRLYGTNAIL